MNRKTFALEERLIQFSLSIIDIVEKLPKTKVGNYIAGQIIRSGLSPSFNYGETQVAESRTDFIHKMKIALKELKETLVALKIVQRKPLLSDSNLIDSLITECGELIAIFVKSIETAKKNQN